MSLLGLESGVGRAGFSWGSREKPLLVSSSFREPRPWLLAPSVHLSSFSRPPVSGFDSCLPPSSSKDPRSAWAHPGRAGPSSVSGPGAPQVARSQASASACGDLRGDGLSVCFGGFQEHSHKELGFASFFLLTFELLYLFCLIVFVDTGCPARREHQCLPATSCRLGGWGAGLQSRSGRAISFFGVTGRF